MVTTKPAVLSLIEECRSMRELKQLHGFMVATALVRDAVPLSRLIDFCVDPLRGDLAHAHALFARFPAAPTTYMWNSMIRGLSVGPEPATTLAFYRDMLRRGRSPDHFTFPFAFKACSRVRDRASGCCLHGRVVRAGYEADVYVSSTLIHMYVSCGSMPAVAALFERTVNRNIVTWTTIIAGYADHDQAGEAIRLFGEMELEGVEPNEITMVHVLGACAQSRDLETGRRIHARLRRAGADSIQRNVVLATALVDMYARCGSLKTARDLFDKMTMKNEVSWNSMISAYNQYDRPNEALQLFKEMQSVSLKPDKVTLLSLLGACADKGSLQLGQAIHACVEKTIGRGDVAISTSLMDMYAKTGDAQSALRIFTSLEDRDVMAWTSMIIALAVHGHGKEAIELFVKMQQDGIVPDHITFIGVLTACSHAGLVEEGHKYFDSMEKIYNIEPTIEHYGCMVDMLSRAGRMAEAEKIVESMPVQPSSRIWSSMLRGCEIHGDAALAERIGNQLSLFNPQGSGTSVLMSNIYAEAGRWQEVEKARELMWKKGLRKTHGSSSI
ncbi:pentatricopeptide repeat-containing protein [Canna indica]|uniref:Pentatricopeptide repeat-containing protein n=1 Tax=Canna indica TaxID=4628 RepID=A0AAQ3JMU6_9LILI|nr:pentatricopeptide repeat-containing protein [Canna indica]